MICSQGISTNDLGGVLGPRRPLNLLVARSYFFSAKTCRDIHKGGSAPGVED